MLVSLAMLALLALVAVASRAERPFAGDAERAPEPSTAVWDYALTLWVLVMVLGAALLLYGFVVRLGEQGVRDTRGRTLALLLALAIFLALIVSLRAFRDERAREPEPFAVPTLPRATTVGREPQARPYEPQFRWRPVVLFAGVALATAAVLLARAQRRQRADEAAENELAGELVTILDETLDDLRAEPDPRRAVIAAYARMERALAAYGLPRRRAEAPLEYLDRVARVHEPHRPTRRLAFELTHLFERAKFSPHAVDAEMKEDAITTLGSLRDELRGAAA